MQVVLLALEVLAELSSSDAEAEITEIYSQQKETPTATAALSSSAGDGSSTNSDTAHQRSTEVALPKSKSLPSVLRMTDSTVANMARLVKPTLQKCGSTSRLTIYFTRLIVSLLSLFSTDRQLLEKRGSFILR